MLVKGGQESFAIMNSRPRVLISESVDAIRKVIQTLTNSNPLINFAMFSLEEDLCQDELKSFAALGIGCLLPH